MLTVNTVEQLLKTKDGDIGGILLKNGTIVDTPKGHGDALRAMIKTGDQVRVEGEMNRTRGGRIHVQARKIALPSRRSNRRIMKKVDDQIPMIAVGEIEKFMMNHHGQIKGFRLTDGTVVITPMREGEHLFAQMKHGDEVHVTGYRVVTSHGKTRILAKKISVHHHPELNQQYHASRHPSDESLHAIEKYNELKEIAELTRVAKEILAEMKELHRELKVLTLG